MSGILQAAFKPRLTDMAQYRAIFFGRYIKGRPHRIREVTIYARNPDHARHIAENFKKRKGETLAGIES